MIIRFSLEVVILGILMSLLGSVFSPRLLVADPTFSVAPGVLTLDLNRARSGALILTNTGNERIRLIVEPVYFPVNSNSLNGGELLDDQFNNKDDLSDKIIVSPRIVVLSPGQKRHVRFSIRLKEKLAPGDYRAHLLVKTQDTPKSQPAAPQSQPSTNSLSIRLAIKLETAVAVYGRVNVPETQLQISCHEDEQKQLVIQTINKSGWNYRGWLGIYNSPEQDTENPDSVLRLISFRESKRTIPTNLEFNQNIVLRWGLTKEELKDGSFTCSSHPLTAE